MAYKDPEKARICNRESFRRKYWKNPEKHISYVVGRRKEKYDRDPVFRRHILKLNAESRARTRQIRLKRLELRGGKSVEQVIAEKIANAAAITRNRQYGIVRRES